MDIGIRPLVQCQIIAVALTIRLIFHLINAAFEHRQRLAHHHEIPLHDLAFPGFTGGNGIDLRNFQASLHLESGRLSIPDLAMTYERGRVRAGLRIDAGTSVPDWDLFIDANAVDMQRLADLVPDNRWEAGIE